jgi:cellulose synthase/poly-beta-1,6-N-acetylglucosamine synthase-like glycosyltransferase
MNNMKIVIVTPVFEDLESATLLFKDLKSNFQGIRVIAVDDGSLHQPIHSDVLEDLGIKGAVITLSRNLGHQAAIAVGLGYVDKFIDDYDFVVVMDSDGEDTPQSIRELVDGFNVSKSHVRVAERKRRNESFKFIQFYRVYKFLFRMLTGKVINFGNFMALKPISVSRLA